MRWYKLIEDDMGNPSAGLVLKMRCIHMDDNRYLQASGLDQAKRMFAKRFPHLFTDNHGVHRPDCVEELTEEMKRDIFG